jgi:hypothetical protein
MRRVAIWLSLVLIFAIPWENMVLIGGLGTLGKALGILVAAFWVITVISTGRLRNNVHVACICSCYGTL